MIQYRIAKLTVGLRDDLDAYYHEHNTIPSRAWVLARILMDPDTGEPAFTEDQIRSLPMAEFQEAWDEFQGAMFPAPLPLAPPGDSSTD